MTPRLSDECADLEPLTDRVATAARITGISRSRLYELVRSGDLDIVKIGRSTLTSYQSLRALTRS